ncbi:MAG TPA: MFS transporter [Pirellulales bacterium]|nr:MFS transporter [Pirellulales bacterium]
MLEIAEVQPGRVFGAAPASLLRRNLKCSVGDGISCSLMTGVGETYLPAFVLALGLGEVAAGLVCTIPLFLGAVLQLIAPRGIRWCGSHRRWVVACAFLQAASFLPLMLGALLGTMPLLLVFVLVAGYFGSGLATSGAWNMWMQHLVPATIRAKFFARRTRLTQISMLMGFVLGGGLLQWSARLEGPLWIFAVLFFLAFLGRAVSATCLALQSEPPALRGALPTLPWRTLCARVVRGSEGRLLLYLWLMQGAAQISGPYFSPFMLEQLHFSYATYVSLLGCSYLAKAVMLPFWGRVAQRHGARRLLAIGGIAVIPMPLLWTVAQTPVFLGCVQLLAGTCWGAFELAAFLIIFDTIRPAERTAVLTIFNLGNAFTTVVGSLLSGALLGLLGRNVPAYLAIFALSSTARLLTVPWLARVPAKLGQSVEPRIFEPAKPDPAVMMLSPAELSETVVIPLPPTVRYPVAAVSEERAA